MAILVKNKDAWLYTTLYPNSGKETVILLHGGPGVPDGLEPVEATLSRHFQVISFHQRGTLNSPCFSGSYTMSSYVSDLDCIATHFGLKQFHLFGHSWGGLYAQIYAAQRQDRLLSMFLCSPATGTGMQWAEMILEVSRFNRNKGTWLDWLSMIKSASLGMLGSYKAYQEFYTQFCINSNKNYRVENLVPPMIDHINARPITRTNLAVLLHPGLQQLSTPPFPITIAYGEDDIFGDTTRYVRERYPAARFITIPNSSHFPWLHNEEEFYKVLADHFGMPPFSDLQP